jgi:hypothetical protein
MDIPTLNPSVLEESRLLKDLARGLRRRAFEALVGGSARDGTPASGEPTEEPEPVTEPAARVA